MDLFRSILLNVESEGKLGSDGYSNEEIADHAQQLKEEGLVEGVIARDHQDIPCQAAIIRLTSKGTTL